MANKRHQVCLLLWMALAFVGSITRSTLAEKALPNQIRIDPAHPDKLVYHRDANQDGRLDPAFLCGPGGDIHEKCLKALENANGRYNVNLAEQYDWHADLLEAGDRDGVRRVNWATAITGTHIMHLGAWETSRKRRPPTIEMLEDELRRTPYPVEHYYYPLPGNSPTNHDRRATEELGLNGDIVARIKTFLREMFCISARRGIMRRNAQGPKWRL